MLVTKALAATIMLLGSRSDHTSETAARSPLSR